MAKTHHLNFAMSDKTYQRFETLMVKCGLSNKTDLIRQALQMYEWLIENHMDDAGFYIKRKADDKPIKVEIFHNAPMN